jgi:elongation factor P hydroxylase
VNGYQDLEVGNVTGRVVTGLNPGTTCYYRVRAYDATSPGHYSNVMTVATVATTGPIIHATFDSSITSNPNAAAIEAMINRAISIYESLFSDPITIQIYFRYATTAPDGTPLPQGTLSRSELVAYTIPWSTFISALRADAKTGNDQQANASLPGTALSASIHPASANGRAVGLNTPPAMFANGTVGSGGPYDGIVTLNSSQPFQFTRPVSANYFDAQQGTEHEMDEVIGFGSRASLSHLRPQDLFSWSSAGHRNITSSGTRYFSINGGVADIVNFNQDPSGDFGDWLSTACPQAHPYVQNAFACTGQYSDVTPTSPDGINLDVIGYDLESAPAPVPTDFNNDGHPDYVLFNSSTRQTVIWYLNNNVRIGVVSGPTLPAGWSVVGVADFNRDGHPDYLLFNPVTRQTWIWYLSGGVHLTGAAGPTITSGYELVGAADFNGDGKPDYLLYNQSTHQTAIWYMNNNVRIGSAYGPTLPGGWGLVAP